MIKVYAYRRARRRVFHYRASHEVSNYTLQVFSGVQRHETV
jgi:hypothetical protein